MPLTIALDGPVGAGKSTVADETARRLGILHLDTGAMYRAMGLWALKQGVDIADEQAVTELAAHARITVRYAEGMQHTLVENQDVTGSIRTPEVSMAASTVARYAGVRKAMVALQQKLAAEQPRAAQRNAQGVPHRLSGGAGTPALFGIAEKGSDGYL